jgi:hypothetical protein
MSNLTAEKLREMMRMLPSRHDETPFKLGGGFRIYDSPPPPPKIQVRDIKLSDGTPLLSPAFRSEMNSWLSERFGFCDDPFKDSVYCIGSALVMRPEYRHMITNVAS